MPGMDDVLDPNETVIWSNESDKKPLKVSLPSRIPVSLFLLFVAVGTLLIIMAELPIQYSSLFWIPVVIVFIITIIRQYWQLHTIPNAEYLITNQRLIIKSEVTNQDVWFVDLDEIKDVVVEIGFLDKIFGTGKLYPITSKHTYKTAKNPLYFDYPLVGAGYSSANISSHPHLENLREPYAVQKLLKELIFGPGTNFVSCKYCNYRYDLNKELKCPHCGGPHPQNYSL